MEIEDEENSKILTRILIFSREGEYHAEIRFDPGDHRCCG